MSPETTCRARAAGDSARAEERRSSEQKSWTSAEPGRAEAPAVPEDQAAGPEGGLPRPTWGRAEDPAGVSASALGSEADVNGRRSISHGISHTTPRRT